MRCVIDAQPILGRRAGVGAYVFEVLKHLPDFLKDDEVCLVLFHLLKEAPIPPGLLKGNVTLRLHRLFPRKVMEKLLKAGLPLPFSLFSGKGDVFLFPNFIAYPTGGKPAALIIYDLSYLRHPERAEAKNQRFLARFVPRSLKRARGILTISNFSRDEISDVYGIPPERIRVAYPGVDSGRFHPLPENTKIQKVLNRYHLPSDYLLFVGTLEPRKGIESLIAAYEMWEDKDRPPLVLIGKRGWGDMPRLTRALRGAIPGIFYPGYVEHGDLPLLLANARLFIYPSVYEGFGMPVLEAMACGTPVVCGNCPSFREIGGDLLTYCESETPDILADALAKILASPLPPEKREAMIQRARSFTWENTAGVIAETVKELAGN